MTTIAIIENYVSMIEKYLDITATFKERPFEEIESDDILRGALERYLYLIIQASTDCADAIISIRKLRKPESLRDSFLILAEKKIIERELSERLGNLTGFRNILSHGYVALDYKKVKLALEEGTKDIQAFIEAVRP